MRRVWALVVLGGFVGPHLLSAQRVDGAPVGVSTMGVPGLITTPVASTLPLGEVALGFNTVPDYAALWDGRRFGFRSQHNALVSFSLFRRLTIGVRATEGRPLEPGRLRFIEGPDGIEVFQYPWVYRDLAPNVHLLLLPEGSRSPGLAVGASDLTGNGNLEARYLVLGKSFGPFAHLSAGFGLGPDLLDGPFGGIRLQPVPWFGAMGEWNSERFLAAVEASPPLPGSFGRGLIQPRVSVVWTQHEGLSWAASLQVPWDRDLAPNTGLGGAEDRPTGVSADSGPQGLADALVELGLENVSVASTQGGLAVAYENRVYNQHQLDALTRVIAAVAASSTAGPEGCTITVLSLGLPVVSVFVSGDGLRRFADGSMDSGTLQVDASYASTRPQSTTPPANPSWGRLDLFLRPALATHLMWDLGVADGRVGIVPTVETTVLRGLSLAAGYRLPIWQTDAYRATRGHLPGGSLDLLLASYTWSRALGGERALAVHWSGGRFNASRRGVRQEAALLLGGGRLRFDLDLAITEPEEGAASVLGVAGARLLLPPSDTRLTLSLGRFLYEDWGIVAGVRRFFGDTEVALTMRQSEHGSVGAFSLALPLGPERSLRPRGFRPRLPASWTLTQIVSLFPDEGVDLPVAFDVAEPLLGRYEAWDRHFDRDRLHPAVIESAIRDGRHWRWR